MCMKVAGIQWGGMGVINVFVTYLGTRPGGGRKKYPVRLGGANKFRWLI